MSKVLEEMKTRRSIRKFKPDMIPQDILDRIIEAEPLRQTAEVHRTPSLFR